MKRHLTEKEFIEYQFDLASVDQGREISRHLDECAECRQHAQRLRSKFAALDLLSDETLVPDDLISKTMEQTKTGTNPTVFQFRKPAWIGAAAAVLVIGFVLLVPAVLKDNESDQRVARNISPVDDFGVSTETGSKMQSDKKENYFSISDRDSRAAKKPGGVASSKAVVGREIAKGEVSEKPPFAPASAIELVTLPRRDNVQITIYNSADLTLVRERRSMTLKKGWNWLQFMWANTLIDPTSLSLEPVAHAEKIDIQQLVFPARLKDIGRWLIRSEIEGQVPFEITYFTSGLSWRAFYTGTLTQDERKMKLQSYVRVDNKSGEDYENAQTRLIVGKVHQLDRIAELAKRQYPYNMPGLKYDISDSKGIRERNIKNELEEKDLFFGAKLESLGYIAGKPKEIVKEGLSEYFLYTIEGTETIPDKWGKRLMSFEADDIEVTSLYKYDEERWGKKAMRFISFANDEDHNLGETPIPDGMVKVYGNVDDQGHLSYVGGTEIKYIPVNEEVELNLGPARLVSVEQVVMDYKTKDYIFDHNGDVAGWIVVIRFKVEISNSRKIPVDIEITQALGEQEWELTLDGQDVTYEKHDAAHVRFTTTLKPQSKKVFTYTFTSHVDLR